VTAYIDITPLEAEMARLYVVACAAGNVDPDPIIVQMAEAKVVEVDLPDEVPNAGHPSVDVLLASVGQSGARPRPVDKEQLIEELLFAHELLSSRRYTSSAFTQIKRVTSKIGPLGDVLSQQADEAMSKLGDRSASSQLDVARLHLQEEILSIVSHLQMRDDSRGDTSSAAPPRRVRDE
jgi:hypothetical protein